MGLKANKQCAPCPFCARSQAIVVRYTQRGAKSRVMCQAMDCGAAGPMAHDDEEAIKRWNNRTHFVATGSIHVGNSTGPSARHNDFS